MTRAVIEDFHRALSRETHHLARWPELLPQQLLNTLQFSDPPIPAVEEVLAVELEAARPWIRRRNPQRQTGLLMLVLEGGTQPTCAIGPRGDFVASGVSDGTLTVWDTRTGEKRASFPVGDSALELVGATPGGDVVCVEEHGSAIRLRDPATAAIRATLRHSTWEMQACAVTERKSFVVLESNGDRLRAWDNDGMAWTERDGGTVRAAALDERLVASATAGGEVSVREVGWKSYEFVASVLGTARWRAPARSAELVGCAVRDQLRAVLLAYADGTAWIGDAATGSEHGSLDAGTREVTSCALGPDYVVVGGADGTVRVLDLRTLGQRFVVRVGRGAVTGCAASPDGSLVVAGGPEGPLTVLDAETGGERAAFTPASGALRACRVSGDGEAVCAATDAGCLEAWWHASGDKWFLWPGPYAVAAAAPSLAGDFVAALTADGVVRVWDTESASERTVPLDAPAPPTSCAISQTGTLVAVGYEDGSLRTVDTRTAAEVTRPRAHEAEVRCCAFGPEGAYVVSGGEDGKLKRWNVPELEEQFAVEASRVSVLSCAVSPDGRFLASGGKGASFGEPARIRDASTGAEVAALEGHDDPEVRACAVSPDASFVVTAGNAVRVWRAEAAERVTGDDVPGGPLCAFRADGDAVMTGWGKQLAVADADTGARLFDLEGAKDTMHSCDASPDGEFFVAGGWGPEVQLWDADSGRPRQSLLPTVGVRGLRHPHHMQVGVSPAGDLVLAAEDSGGIRIWGLRTGIEWLLDKGDAVNLTPDGESIVSERDGEIALVDIRTGGVVRTLPGREGAPLPHRPPRVACDGKSVRVLDFESGEERAAIELDIGEREGSVLTPDWQYFVVGGRDRTVRLVRLDPLEAVATIPLLGHPVSLAAHPWRPLVACGDFTGSLNLLDLVGIEYGPIVVTPVDDGEGPVVRCPKCRRPHLADPEPAGRVSDCPTPGCGLRLRMSGAVARPLSGMPAAELMAGERVPELTGLPLVLNRMMDDLDAQKDT